MAQIKPVIFWGGFPEDNDDDDDDDDGDDYYDDDDDDDGNQKMNKWAHGVAPDISRLSGSSSLAPRYCPPSHAFIETNIFFKL